MSDDTVPRALAQQLAEALSDSHMYEADDGLCWGAAPCCLTGQPSKQCMANRSALRAWEKWLEENP